MFKNKWFFLLLLMLSVIVMILMYNNKASSIEQRFRSFSISDTSAINKMVIIKGVDTICLERNKSKHSWVLNRRYTANQSLVSRLLYTISKIDIKSPVSKSENEELILQLMMSGIRCELYQNNKLATCYYIEENPVNKPGSAMVLINLRSGAPYSNAFYTHVPGYNGYIASHYMAAIIDWKDKTIFNYDSHQIKSIHVENPIDGTDSYSLQIQEIGKSAIVKLSDGRMFDNVDSVALNQYLTYFYRLQYEQLDTFSVSSKQHIRTISVIDENNQLNRIEVFLRKSLNETDSPLKTITLSVQLPDGELVVVNPNVFGKIMQNADYFLTK